MTNIKIALLGLLAAATAALLGIVGATGCHKQSSGIPIASYSALKPDHLELKRCILKLAGTIVTADIVQTRKGDEIVIDLRALGQVFETERYTSTDQDFCVLDAGGEVYDPPIPLIKYPMRVGDEWDWTGRIMTGQQPHPAKAKVTTASEAMMVNGGTVPAAVRVQVELQIDSGRPNAPSKRMLTFWIAPDMGVVRRSFGDYSSREPAEE